MDAKRDGSPSLEFGRDVHERWPWIAEGEAVAFAAKQVDRPTCVALGAMTVWVVAKVLEHEGLGKG